MAALASPAWSQVAETVPSSEGVDSATDSPTVVDVFVVTGTRLLGAAASEPVTSIDSEEIRLRGIESVDQLLRQVSSNNTGVSLSNPGSINGFAAANRGNSIANLSGGSVADLRGLGAGSTLVLLNGRRLAGEGNAGGDFADISGIPIEAIERVDILTAGASAIYGADAVAGVINIILKKNYSDQTVRLRAGFSESGADDYTLSFTSGMNWTGGNLTLTGSYQKQDAVDAQKFGVRTLDFRDRGGDDRRRLTSTRGVFTSSEFGFGSPPTDVFGANGLVLPEGSGPVTAGTDVSTFDVVPRDELREVLPVSLTPEFDVLAGSARFDQDVSLGFIGNVFADASFSLRNTVTEVEAPEIEISPFSFTTVPGGVPFPNPDPFDFSPFRTDIQYSFDTTELVEAGVLQNDLFDTESRNLNLEAGVRGNLAKEWSWEGAVIFSQDKNFDLRENYDLFELIDGVFNPDTFETEGAVNLIRNDFLTNSEIAQTLADVREISEFDSKTNLVTAQAFARGRMFTQREAGPLAVVIGGELRKETIDNEVRLIGPSGDSVLTPDLDASRDTTAIFAEASFPLSKRFVVNAAARYETVENMGTSVTRDDALATFAASGGLDQRQPIDTLSEFEQSDDGISPRLGVAWTPFDFVLLRGTIGQSFRAPNVNEVGRATTVSRQFSFGDPILDPRTGLELDPIANPRVSGGNPELKSEIADTINLGSEFDFDVGSHNIGFELGFFKIDYKDRITSSAPFRQQNFSNPPLPLREPAIVRDANGDVAFTFIGPINVAEQETAGFDIAASHRASLFGLDWDSRFDYSRLTKDDRRALRGEPEENILGIDSPKTRWTLRTTVQEGGFAVTGVVRHAGDFTNQLGSEIDSSTITDLNIVYRFDSESSLTDGVRLTVGATNLFNTDPQFVNFGNGFATNSYDLRRRVIYVDVSKTF